MRKTATGTTVADGRRETNAHSSAEVDQAASTTPAARLPLDPYRAFIFPNRVRELRRAHGYPKLLALSALLPEIPYIRLSKIERGEVFARPHELVRIASALGVAPTDLLLDVEAPDFSIEIWAEPFLDSRSAEPEQERVAILLGAAMRARRDRDRSLTIAAIDKQFGLAPVVLSRIENAHKPLERWNGATVSAIAQIFGVPDGVALRHHVLAQEHRGELTAYLNGIANAETRLARTRDRVLALRAELASPEMLPSAAIHSERPAPVDQAALIDAAAVQPAAELRLLPVFGTALPDGLIALGDSTGSVPAPAGAGPRAFGLRVCRATLGGGLPGNATVVVDPDRYPPAGGLAAIRVGNDYRLLATTLDRSGVMTGYSLAPDMEVTLDTLDPARVGSVIAALFL